MITPQDLKKSVLIQIQSMTPGAQFTNQVQKAQDKILRYSKNSSLDTNKILTDNLLESTQ